MMTSIARRRWLWRRHITIRGRPRARALFVYSMTRSSVGGRNRNGQEDSVGRLVDGVWQDDWSDTANTGGRFVRKDSEDDNKVSAAVKELVAMMVESKPGLHPHRAQRHLLHTPQGRELLN